jgi:mannose-6-phosphate isomerase-like protein (cupin superfamily)
VEILMKNLIFAFLLALSFTYARAQSPAPPTKLFASAAEIQALMAKAKAHPKPDGVNTVEAVTTLEPYHFQLEYRTSVTPPALHHGLAGFLYVVDGSATLVWGGKLTGIKPHAADAVNLVGTGIEGGTRQPLHKGDYAMIPAEAPHQFQDIRGAFVMVAVHLPSK